MCVIGRTFGKDAKLGRFPSIWTMSIYTGHATPMVYLPARQWQTQEIIYLQRALFISETGCEVLLEIQGQYTHIASFSKECYQQKVNSVMLSVRSTGNRYFCEIELNLLTPNGSLMA